MAHWNWKTGKTTHMKPTPIPEYPGWESLDCGCSGGLEWGGEQPRECRDCGGNGVISHHIKSGAHALYPGGPFV